LRLHFLTKMSKMGSSHEGTWSPGLVAGISPVCACRPLNCVLSCVMVRNGYNGNTIIAISFFVMLQVEIAYFWGSKNILAV